MFPEIVRDEVFRLETRRLWLRWPTTGDAFDGTAVTNAASNQDSAGLDIRLPGLACVAAWRAAMEKGEALHLMLEDQADRTVIGTIHLRLPSPRQCGLDYWLVAGRRGEGLMTEAVQAAVHMVFLLDVAPVITASPLAGDSGGRGILERCGFTYVGSGMRGTAAGVGLTACDHFRLDRRTWSSLRGWGSPGLSGLSSRAAPLTPRMPAMV